MKILVTGGAGFIGSTLVDALVDQGHELCVIDNLITGKKEYLNKKAKFYKVDICDKKQVEKVFEKEKIDYVFHLAAQIDVRRSVEDPVFDNKINVFGGLNILDNCLKYKVKKIIFTSTGGAVYGDTNQIPTKETTIPMPISPYGIHKLTFEKYLNYYYQLHGQKYTAIRPANVYGPRQFKGGEAGVVSIFVSNAVSNIKSTISGTGKQTRDFVFVNDLVRAMILAMKSDFVGEINIGTEVETNLLDIVEAIEKALDKKISVDHGPARPGEQMRSCLSNELAKKILGWKPEVGLTHGIKRTIEWSKSQR